MLRSNAPRHLQTFHPTAGGFEMGLKDWFEEDLFDLRVSANPSEAEPPELARARAMQGSAADKAEFFRNIHIDTEQFLDSMKFIQKLIGRANRTDRPGGLWLIGEGGTGKSLILQKIFEQYPPVETKITRNVSVLVVSLDEKTSESSILISLILQLGQDPELLRYRDNADLREQVIDALRACQTRAILFDESHHIWLKPNGKPRSADRSGGSVGGFLKRFYDRTGVAMIFAGTPGLEEVLKLNDKQSKTRWTAEIRLTEFKFDAKFVGVLKALDNAIPLPEKSELDETNRAQKIYRATNGNFRALKNFLAECVFLAAEKNCSYIADIHLREAFFNLFGLLQNPFA